jgi:regulator of nonsense transcripts 1
MGACKSMGMTENDIVFLAQYALNYEID